MHQSKREVMSRQRNWLRISRLGAFFALLVSGAAGLAVAHANRAPEIQLPSPESRSGGDYTTRLDNRYAFAQSAPPLTPKERRDFFFGNRLFNTNWVIAPGSVQSFDGLGPTFNRVSCSGCHTRDGRGRPPADASEPMDSILIRISIPGTDAHGGPRPHPAYGDQLNDRAIPGVPAEGRVDLAWETIKGFYPDGTSYELEKPVFTLKDPAFGPFGKNLMTSPRVAPQVFGLGLLEAVPEADVLARSDPDDADGDGISGRPNHVHNPVSGKTELGRFGWKANQPNLIAQNSAASIGDIGLTTSIHPEQNCPPAQKACAAAVPGGSPELSDEFLAKLTFYTETLAVPARRDATAPEVQKGGRLFVDAGCASCHTPTMKTGANVLPASRANQTFHAYTDMLLHDMGPGLADGRPDFEATGSEWRTPPLWGIGLIPVVNGHDRLLHDGRARGVEEAILWHDGEAASARGRFMALEKVDRDALIAFVKSL